MFKTILASLTGYGSDRPALDAAVAIARVDGGHIHCLHTRMGIVDASAWNAYARPEQHHDLHRLGQEIAAEQAERLRHAKEAFDSACVRHALVVKDAPSDAGVSIAWQEVETFLNQTLHEARYHDLVVMAREEKLSVERIESVLMQSGRPLLLAPRKPVAVIGRKVAIAWKPSAESARAVTAATSILSQAEQVSILSVSENGAGDDTGRASAEHLANCLKWHGVTARVGVEASPPGSASEALKEMAYNCDADLLVMGGYGHSRVREFVFGGVTRDILADCAIPVFMVR
jgi:nucleotide-binding universal stress UspA family protein